MRHLVLLGVGVLDVADGALDALHEGGHAFIALAAHAHDHVHRGAFADGALPLRADLGQVVGEDEGSAGAVSTAYGENGVLGQLDARVQAGDRRVIPALDLAEENFGG